MPTASSTSWSRCPPASSRACASAARTCATCSSAPQTIALSPSAAARCCGHAARSRGCGSAPRRSDPRPAQPASVVRWQSRAGLAGRIPPLRRPWQVAAPHEHHFQGGQEMRSSTESPNGSTNPGGEMAAPHEETQRGFSRRAFIASGMAVGVGAGLGPFGGAVSALADKPASTKLGTGGAAILRFLAAAEILETDFWQQYNELGGVQDGEVPGGSGSEAYRKALEVLDEDMPQYIHDNTEDEFTHFTFLNAYLESRGAKAVDLKEFASLPSSKATGAQQIGRLTNLMELTVDTSWWTRYRSSTKNPDLGDTFAQAVPALAEGEFPAIPRSDADLEPANHIQAIANTAGFHFATIEQGGTSLYPALAQRTRDAEALRVVLSIGPTEAMHFQTWQDKAGNAPALTDPTNPKLVFP